MGNQPICSEMIAKALKRMTFIRHGKASSYTRAYFWPILKLLFGYIPNAKKYLFFPVFGGKFPISSLKNF